jgi:hypothetical protein
LAQLTSVWYLSILCVRMVENVLRKAAEVTEQAKKRNSLSIVEKEKREKKEVLTQAEILCSKITKTIKGRIIKEAKKGNSYLEVMQMTTDSTKKSIAGINNYYNSENPVHETAFELVFQKCEKMNLNPEKEFTETNYGEPIDAIEKIVVRWPKKQ